MAALSVAVVWSDVSDDTHHLWRDPVSFFGAAPAPHPTAVNATIAAVGVTLVGWSMVRYVGGRDVLYAVSAAAGVLAVFVAVWPIDCSPVDELCEVLIRGRAVSTSHDAHSVAGLLLFALLVAITVVAGWRLRRGPDRARSAVAMGCVAIALASFVALVARPFAAGQAVLELLVVMAAAVAIGVGRRRPVDGASLLEA